MEEIFARLDALNARVHLIRNNESWIAADARWSCTIKLHTDGTQIETIKSAPTVEEAISLALTAIEGICNNGVSMARLAAPVDA